MSSLCSSLHSTRCGRLLAGGAASITMRRGSASTAISILTSLIDLRAAAVGLSVLVSLLSPAGEQVACLTDAPLPAGFAAAWDEAAFEALVPHLGSLALAAPRSRPG